MSERALPSRRNPLMPAVNDDDHRKELVAKRRLGQTELQVDAGQVGTSNATKPKNLGAFDYAHIRVALPRDLKGSGIFHASRGHSTPDAYFLMRRSSDGYVSATGMFKSTFPWASEAEEKAEKAHFQSIPGVSKNETAGNVWIPPQQALELAEEYLIRDWMDILLDPSPIETDSKSKKAIKSPPIFHPQSASPSSPARSTRAKTPILSNGASIPPPETSPKELSPRKRALRSTSPVKMAPPEEKAKAARKIATPKRTKRGRNAAASASVEPEEASAAAAPKSRKTSRTVKKDAEPAEVTPAAEEEEGTVKVSIQSAIEPSPTGDVEIETTKVEIETPARHPALGLPDDAQAYLDSAKKAIQEARVLQEAHQGSVRGRKRKAVDISRDDEEDEPVHGTDGEVEPTLEEKEQSIIEDELPAPKRRKINEIERRKDRVKRRAAYGIAAGVAVGAMIPYVFSTFLGF
ncbi:DNA-binding domain of Mlu1-box binding protein MBP1 [Myriangium duriaei CBS 260.36]|uniref:DNA-binding domain of Mlu1-box binding protein MBP1 n=1 Tax=Myriangium duriaei CBS 260.36 TaxID=1168546 RepID=A0A9P4MGW1_9PEZI|nr:DNA-binding domain of Mlu1-box binding protein MBP1 [Myriangium duriaei CBS 260.36]